ncbi:nSTAND1 domain-containing NTPase [Streptomyces telluris]|uniref:Helix-turn-helix domain-containing protein n=1 Tax=Streptomyces telluris TaxID=2720021 RepID=A0A9X2LLQ3_9ACTN|nr:helix-turn-helix domain-containing protein [Streptomyces telluris]MCQ8773644.1 helix-turn-helix domain-containing protein [Streptomyces telluris]
MERLAWELRQLRDRAGITSYRALAKAANYSPSTLSEAAKGERLPQLGVVLAYAQACGGDRGEWEARWRAASKACETPEEAAPCPYPGLAAFDETEAGWFFGRGDLVKTLSRCVECEPLTFVVGASGSGKSSLLRAGLLPRLGQRWRAVLLTPGTRPLSELAAAVSVLGDTGTGAESLRQQLAGDPAALDLALSTWLAGQHEDTRVLLVIDQFEEVFTLCSDAAERSAFLDAVAETAAGRPGVGVAIGVRADFTARCFAHSGLVAAIRAGVQVPVGPPTRDELREIIAEPAARVGVAVDAGLIEAVLGEAADQPGALPLVAHAMRETWNQRPGAVLRLEDYRATGGMRSAVAQTAERVYGAADRAQQDVIRAVFLRLTALGEGTEDTRRRLARAELDGLAETQAVDVVLRRLTAARLVVLSHGTVEVAHEAVIQAWPRLQRWLHDDRDALRTHHRLTTAACTWHELGRDAGALYRGVQLAAAREWAESHPKALNNHEAEFLRTSTTATHRSIRRTHQLVTALSVLLILALAATAVAVRKTAAADTQRRLAVSRELAARADQLSEQRPEAAMILALEAYQHAATAEARGSLLSAHARFYANQFTGHAKPVTDAAFAPDGRTLATASFDHSVKLWDTHSHRLLATLTGHTDVVNTVAYSPDGHTLATAGNDRSIKLWDAPSHRLLATLTGHTNMAESVAFSPDGRTLASAGSDRTVRLWDVRTHRELATLTGHTDAVVRLSFSPDGRMLASADNGRTTRLWDVSTHKTLAVLAGSAGAVKTVAFSPDGGTLATAGGDRSVKLWDVSSRRLLTTLTGHTRDVRDVAFSPDGRTLASASIDGTVRLWSPQEREALATLTVKEPVYAVAFSPDGRTLASTGKDSTAVLWDVASHRPEATLTGRSGAVTPQASFADPHAFFTVDYDNLVARWSTTTQRSRPAPIDPPKPVTASVASDDGRILATTGHDDAIRVWNLGTGKPAAVLRGTTGTARQLAITPDGSTVAVGSNDGTIRLWDVATGDTTAVLRETHTVTGLALSPDGRALASAGTDGRVRLWTIGPGRTGTPLPGPEDANMALAFSPDGRTLAVGNTGNSLRLWDIATRRTTATLTANSGFVRAIAFSPDGRVLASAGTDGSVRLWSTSTSRLLATLTGPAIEGIPTLRFSPDGNALAAFGPRNAPRVWSTDANYAGTWSSGADYAARVWSADAGHTATHVCRLSTDHRWAQLLPDQPVKELCP